MKDDDKKTIGIALLLLFLIIGFFAIAPDMDERTKAIQAYQKPTEKQQKKVVADKSFYSVFLSWTDREGILYGSFYYVNNLKKDVKESTLECMTFDGNKKLLDTLETKVTEVIPKQSNVKVRRLEIGKINKKTTQVSCRTIGYK
ncbi:MAG: hypothetical protein OIF32_04585 [Campylobacterales bacterium]|nr:hypothetical protein [Campylobacterales bacterium]